MKTKVKIKRYASAVLAAVILLSAIPLSGITNLDLPGFFSVKSSALANSGNLSNSVSYNFDEETGILTISGTGEIPDYSYPNDGNPSPFCNSTLIKSVIIEDGITRIGHHLLYNCTKMDNISIGKDVKYISGEAFRYCSSLKEINIPAATETISTDRLHDCQSLERINVDKSNEYYCSVDEVLYNKDMTVLLQYPMKKADMTEFTVPDSVKTIGPYSFERNTVLEKITIGSNVETIKLDAFENCTGLKEITFGEKVTTIGPYAFAGCSGLKGITLPNGLSEIDRSIFQNCTSLEKVTFGKNIKVIVQNAFENCNSLTDVYFNGTEEQWNSITVEAYYNEPLLKANIHFAGIYLNGTVYYIFDEATGTLTIGGEGAIRDYTPPITSPFYYDGSIKKVIIEDGITRIGSFTFRDCHSVSYVEIADSVTSIGTEAFYECDSLESITIPAGVTEIEPSPFWGCKNLISINIDRNNPVYDSRDNCNAIIETATNTLVQGCLNTVIPDSVTSINDRAFAGCTSLEDIMIPNSVTNIGVGAFASCSNLKNIHIPEGVTGIGAKAFYKCANLTEITIPDSVAVIDNNAFLDCDNLTDIYVNWTDNITEIDRTAETQQEKVFCSESADIYQNATLHVPAGTKALYEAAFGWKDFANITENIPVDGKIYLTDTVYYNYDEETGTLVLGGTGAVPDYETSPFKNLNITNAIIDSGITSVGANTFKDCETIEEVFLSSSVSSVKTNAFSGCDLLKVVYAGADNTGFSNAFDKNNELLFFIVKKDSQTEKNAKAAGIEYVSYDNTQKKNGKKVVSFYGTTTVYGTVGYNYLSYLINENSDAAYMYFDEIVFYGVLSDELPVSGSDRKSYYLTFDSVYISINYNGQAMTFKDLIELIKSGDYSGLLLFEEPEKTIVETIVDFFRQLIDTIEVFFEDGFRAISTAVNFIVSLFKRK